MTADAYGKTLAGLSLNLIVRDGRAPARNDGILEDPDGYTFAVGVRLR